MGKGRAEGEISKLSAKMFSRAGIHGNKWNHFELEGGYLWETVGIASGITASHQPKNVAACRISRSAKDSEAILKPSKMRGHHESLVKG